MAYQIEIEGQSLQKTVDTRKISIDDSCKKLWEILGTLKQIQIKNQNSEELAVFERNITKANDSSFLYNLGEKQVDLNGNYAISNN